jgi:hypothetical protein
MLQSFKALWPGILRYRRKYQNLIVLTSPPRQDKLFILAQLFEDVSG